MHEKLSELKLFELKLLARELHIPLESIRAHGDLRLRATWLSAIASAIADIEAEIADTAPVPADSATTETATTSPQNVTSSELLPKMRRSSEFVTKLACMIAHPALHEGELREVADGWDYIGTDERGLPIAIVDEEDGILYPVHDDVEALPVSLGMEYFLYCLRNRKQLHNYYLEVAA